MSSPLTADDLKGIKKDMKSFSRGFEVTDRAIYSSQNAEEVERRRRIVDDHRYWHQQRLAVVNAAEAIAVRKALRDGVDTEQDDDMEDVVVERLIKDEEIVVDHGQYGF